MPTRKGEPQRYSDPTDDPEIVARAEKLRKQDEAFLKKIKIPVQKGLQRQAALVDGVAKQNETVKLDVNTAIQKQEESKRQKFSDAKHNVNLMLNSLETASALVGLINTPWMFLSRYRIPSTLLQKGGNYLTNRNILPATYAQLPSLYANSIESRSMYPSTLLYNANNNLGMFVDGAQMLTSNNLNDRLINGVELGTNLIPNQNVRMFANYLQNGFDYLNNQVYK